MLVACKSRETVLNKVIYQKKQLQNPANPGFLTSPPQAPKIFGGFFPPYFGPWGEKTLFSPHFPDPGGKIEKAVSPHNGGEKDTPDQGTYINIWRRKTNGLSRPVFFI